MLAAFVTAAHFATPALSTIFASCGVLPTPTAPSTVRLREVG